MATMTKINDERFWRDIMETARWGEIPGQPGGMMRLALTDEDRHVRDWLCKEAQEIGCEILVDQMGSIFAVLAGENRKLAPIAMGSHLDTQPAGMWTRSPAYSPELH